MIRLFIKYMEPIFETQDTYIKEESQRSYSNVIFFQKG